MNTCLYTYTYIHPYTYMNTCLYTYTYIHPCTYMNTCLYTYIHTCDHKCACNVQCM